MFKKNVGELEKGMILAEKIYSPQSDTMLLKEGTILSDAMILTLKARQVSSVQIAEKYTLMVNPIEIIAKELKGILLKRIATLFFLLKLIRLLFNFLKSRPMVFASS